MIDVRCLRLFGLLWLSCVLVRLVLYHEEAGAQSLLTLIAGLSSDLLVGVVVGSIFYAVFGDRNHYRTSILVLLFLWGLVNVANLEHIVALNASAHFGNLHYLFDEVFFLGSGSVTTRPLLLLTVAGLIPLISFLIEAQLAMSSVYRRFPRVMVICLLVLSWLSHLGTTQQPGPRGWRSVNVIHENTARVISNVLSAEQPIADVSTQDIDRVFLSADLNGTIRPSGISLHKKPNILILVLEGVSGAYIPSFSRSPVFDSTIKMPKLDHWMAKGLRFNTFVSHQRGTSRGLYAMLCGAYPKLRTLTSKMTEYINYPNRRCLPSILREQGYDTAYLQAAPLRFMSKDQFMAKAGFNHIHGANTFTQGYVKSAWGVDDRGLLEGVERFLSHLSDKQKPWFATVLTVGTHHPFTVPANYRPESDTDLHRAYAYLDDAVDRFLTRLNSKGFLDNTLVVLTSDESTGTPMRGQVIPEMLSQNWGFMGLFGTGLKPGVTDEVFGLVDLPLSILDGLGLAGDAPDFVGRSMFRSYDTGRHIFFANTNQDMVGHMSPTGRLILCEEILRKCWAYRRGVDEFIAVQPAEVPVGLEEIVTLRRVARHSDVELLPLRGMSGTSSYKLLNPVTWMRGAREKFFNFAAFGQKISVDDGSSMQLVLDIAVCALENPDSVVLKGVLVSQEKMNLPRVEIVSINTRPLQVGDRFVYQFQTTAEHRHPELEFWFYSDLAPEQAAKLIVHSASLTVIENNNLPRKEMGGYSDFDCSTVDS